MISLKKLILSEAKAMGFILKLKSKTDYVTIVTAIKAGLLDQYAPEPDHRSNSIFFGIPNQLSTPISQKAFAKRLFSDLTDLELSFKKTYVWQDLIQKDLVEPEQTNADVLSIGPQ